MILASGLNTVTTQRTTGPRYSDSKATFEHDDFFLSQLTALKTFEKTHSKCLEKLETSAYGHQCCCYVHLC